MSDILNSFLSDWAHYQRYWFIDNLKLLVLGYANTSPTRSIQFCWSKYEEVTTSGNQYL